MELKPALYLIPVNISEAPLDDVIPAGNLPVVKSIRHLIVENVRTARRFLKRWDRTFDIDSITFYELNGHTDPKDISSYLEPLRLFLWYSSRTTEKPTVTKTAGFVVRNTFPKHPILPISCSG